MNPPLLLLMVWVWTYMYFETTQWPYPGIKNWQHSLEILLHAPVHGCSWDTHPPRQAPDSLSTIYYIHYEIHCTMASQLDKGNEH